jgi:PAS domain S-box-containing protein
MANAAFLETNGLSPDTLDKDVTQYRAHSGAQAMLDADLRVMENNLPEQVEELVVDAGGKARTLLTSKVPWHDENGKVIGLIGIARDISERKRMEDQLRESEELLRSVIENTSDTILLKDRHGRVLMANSAYLVANGVAFEDIEAKSAKQYHPDPSFGQRFLKEDLLVIHTNRARAFEATLPMPDGKRTRTMLVSKSPWRNDKGEAIGVICIAHNITRRKEMERTLRKTAEDLAQKNRLITDFFTNISHELKTPLAIILVQLELMVLNAQNSDKICALAASATQNAFRLSRLVDNLLDITRIDGGHMPIDLVDVDAVSLIRNIVETVKVYAHEKDIIVRFASSVREKIMPFDIEKTERIMFNLLSNAIKFTPSGGRITVRVQDRGEAGVAISVSDTGIGIPSDKLFAIFDRFEQVDSSMSKQNEGCGIGLSLVKALVQLLGGTIEVKSRINRGSRFIVTLPICSALHRSTRTKFHSRDLAKKAEVELSDLSL